ncbi:hypothetical protein L6452_02609 [Arctium lappa]|uniref:Uncharacterized protein n=1 Tax=Arctium lappa TaxID=4217 RepID=A0ACB9FKW0_ARCLA|nr:hypothetical protein L6452_02609 [Arctium lappa]
MVLRRFALAGNLLPKGLLWPTISPWSFALAEDFLPGALLWLEEWCSSLIYRLFVGLSFLDGGFKGAFATC